MFNNAIVVLQTFALVLFSILCLLAVLSPRLDYAIRSSGPIRIGVSAVLFLLCLHAVPAYLMAREETSPQGLFSHSMRQVGSLAFLAVALAYLLSSIRAPSRLGRLVACGQLTRAQRLVSGLALLVLVGKLAISFYDNTLFGLLIEDAAWTSFLPPSVVERLDLSALFFVMATAGFLGCEIREKGVRTRIGHLPMSEAASWDVSLKERSITFWRRSRLAAKTTLHFPSDRFAEVFEFFAGTVGVTAEPPTQSKARRSSSAQK